MTRSQHTAERGGSPSVRAEMDRAPVPVPREPRLGAASAEPPPRPARVVRSRVQGRPAQSLYTSVTAVRPQAPPPQPRESPTAGRGSRQQRVAASERRLPMPTGGPLAVLSQTRSGTPGAPVSCGASSPFLPKAELRPVVRRVPRRARLPPVGGPLGGSCLVAAGRACVRSLEEPPVCTPLGRAPRRGGAWVAPIVGTTDRLTDG